MGKLLAESTHKGNYKGAGTIRPLVVDQRQIQAPYSVYEDITPQIAQSYLDLNANNRKITQHEVDRFAIDMKNNKWRLTHQGIAFDTEGFLLDGQHRLLAIIQSKATIRMMVTRNVPRDSNDGVDGGRNRTVPDLLHYQGKSARTVEVAIATLLLPGALVNKRHSRIEIMESFYRHETAIRSVMGMFPKHKQRVTIKAVLTPMVRAWYVVDREKLRRFAEVLFTGQRENDDEAVIIRFRDYLLLQKSVSGKDQVSDLYAKAERMLQAYLNGEAPGRVLTANRELFLLPGEEEDATIN